MNLSYKNYIGVIDSGVGGISVLKRAADALPAENFVYFGDSANAPYGEKDPDWVRKRTQEIVDGLVSEGCKAIVIACNTATSAAAECVRTEHAHLPIIGVEPALKVAVTSHVAKSILVMATPVTVRLQKYQQLYNRWGQCAGVKTAICWGLAGRIEAGNLGAPDVLELLERLIGEYKASVDGVVLGCTHYPFVASQIRKVLGRDVPLFDGAFGTARQLKAQLQQRGLLANESCTSTKSSTHKGKIVFRSSINTPAQLKLYEAFFAQGLETNEWT